MRQNFQFTFLETARFKNPTVHVDMEVLIKNGGEWQIVLDPGKFNLVSTRIAFNSSAVNSIRRFSIEKRHFQVIRAGRYYLKYDNGVITRVGYTNIYIGDE